MAKENNAKKKNNTSKKQNNNKTAKKVEEKVINKVVEEKAEEVVQKKDKKEDKVVEKDEIEVVETKEKKKKEKKEKPKKEKVKKEKVKKEKTSLTEKIKKIDDNRKAIFGFVLGLLLGLLILLIVWPDRIATLKDGTQPIAIVKSKTITADDLYEDMKKAYSVSKFLDSVDTIILEKKYPETDEMNEEVANTAESYLSYYEQNYGYTEEQFLSSNGFASYDEFLEYLKLDYRRNKYYDEYLEDKISVKDIEEYYDEEVFGDINCQHVLVAIDDETDSEAAKKLAQEIIDKLNDGTSWEDIQEEYEDKITYEDLGYQAFNAKLEESFMDALKSMDNDSFSKEPVETSYGFHVIHRLDQKKKAKLDDIEKDIIEELKDELAEEDKNIYYKAMIQMREDAKLEFKDSGLKEEYDDYKKQYK